MLIIRGNNLLYKRSEGQPHDEGGTLGNRKGVGFISLPFLIPLKPKLKQNFTISKAKC
jgi:hypothetical protein